MKNKVYKMDEYPDWIKNIGYWFLTFLIVLLIVQLFNVAENVKEKLKVYQQIQIAMTNQQQEKWQICKDKAISICETYNLTYEGHGTPFLGNFQVGCIDDLGQWYGFRISC